MNVIILLVTLLPVVYGHDILCVQSTPSKSHYNLFMGLIKPLLEAGHKITWVTPFPESQALNNLRYIDISHVRKLVENSNITNKRSQGLGEVKEFAWNMSRAAVETPEVREIVTRQQFDAVITEWFFSEVEAGYAAVQQAPWVLLSGITYHSRMEYLVDTIRSVPTIPGLFNDYPIPMNFWQRIMNTVSFFFTWYHTEKDYPKDAKNYEHYFGPLARARGVELQPYSEAIHNISILFVNGHPSLSPAQTLPPNVVEIGGYHIDEHVPPLPKDLQDLMDSSPQGVIYFSMGSVVKSATLPNKTKQDLIKIFGELPYTVLWKFEEKMEGLPKNLHIRPWMPQSSILTHPNVKVFITHGGLLSTLESLHFGVPIIAVPVFGDQPGNALRSVRAGHALKVDFKPDMGDELKMVLKEMLSNDSYYKRTKEISKLFRNRPVANKKLIQHYIELAIESKGALHLRSKSQLYSWYQIWMLDQIALAALVLYIIAVIIKKIVNSLIGKMNVKGKKEKKK